MMRGAALSLILLLTACTAPQAQPAAMNCAPREAVVAALEANYGEHQVGRGINADGALIELFASPNGETWTLISSGPDGISCWITDGRAWRTKTTDPAA